MKSLSFSLVVMVGAFACGYGLQQGMRAIRPTADPAATVVAPTVPMPTALPDAAVGKPPEVLPILLTSAQREAASRVVFAGEDASLDVLRAHFEEKAGLNRKPPVREIQFDSRIDPAIPEVLRVTVRFHLQNGVVPVEAVGKLSIRVKPGPEAEVQTFDFGAAVLADYLVREPGLCEYRLSLRPRGAFDGTVGLSIAYAGPGGEVLTAAK